MLEGLKALSAEVPAGAPKAALPRVARVSSNVLERLDLELAAGAGRSRVLLTGQIGVGKSTELWAFRRKCAESQSILAIVCDLEREMSPERCGPIGVLLAIFRDAWSFHRLCFHKPPPNDITDRVLSTLVDWLKAKKTDEGYVFRFGGMDFPLDLSNEKSRIVAIILGKATQHQALSDRDPTEGLVPDQLVYECNRYLQYLNRRTNKEVVLLVDHVDKIRDESAARATLIDAVSHWGRLDASLVMTAPYEFTLGAMRSSVEGFWGRPAVVYPEPIPSLVASNGDDPVPDFYREIIGACGLTDLLSDDDLRVLAHYSGGIPRTFVLLLAATLRNAIFATAERVEAIHVRMAVSEAQADYQDYPDADLQRLDEIERTQQGLGRAMELLRSPIGLLVQPAPDRGTVFRVHPLAERSLRLYRERGGYSRTAER